MKVSDMVKGKKYKCVRLDCVYSDWSAEKIKSKMPWMVDLYVWEEE